MAQKDEELGAAKANLLAVKRELEKSQSKLKSYADYISGLPTPDDVKKSEQLVSFCKNMATTIQISASF